MKVRRWHGSIALAALCWLGAADTAAALGSCGTGGGGTARSVQFNGAYYNIWVPAGYSDGQEWPLILGLHGDEGSPEGSVNQSWGGVANERFIFVAPKSPTANGSWYNPNEISQTATWFDDLLKHLFASYNIDLDQVHAWGLSGGAEFLSYHGLSKLQNVLATIQFNMGGNYWGWFLAGQPRRGGSCKIPARFSVYDGTMDQCGNPAYSGIPTFAGGVMIPTNESGNPTDGDFLCSNAKGLWETLDVQGHQSIWTGWNEFGAVPCFESRGHCWNPQQNEGRARDWMLGQTLCGFKREVGCGQGAFDQDPLADPDWVPGGQTPMQMGTGGMPGTSGTAGMSGTAGVMGSGGPAGTGGLFGGGPMGAANTGTDGFQSGPPVAAPDDSSSSGGCTLGGGAPSVSLPWLLAAALLWVRRRRGASGASPSRDRHGSRVERQRTRG